MCQSMPQTVTQSHGQLTTSAKVSMTISMLKGHNRLVSCQENQGLSEAAMYRCFSPPLGAPSVAMCTQQHFFWECSFGASLSSTNLSNSADGIDDALSTSNPLQGGLLLGGPGGS